MREAGRVIRATLGSHGASSWMLLLQIVLHVAPGALRADVPRVPLAVDLSAPSVPAGAVAQLRVALSAPHRISSCSLALDLDPAVFGPAADIDVLSATGDQAGKVVITGNRLEIAFASESGGIGQLPGVPMIVINVPVLANAPAATTVSFPSARSPLNNRCDDVFGHQYTISATAAPFKVGGALSIDSVAPGGGLLPSATKVRIGGRGFAPAATIQIEGVPLSAAAFVTPQEIDVTLAAPADLTGRRVLVMNPDGSIADFYPALRGKKTYRANSSSGVVQAILPQQTYSYATLGSSTGYGFAIQNPTLRQVNTVLHYGATIHGPSSDAAGTLEPGETFVYLPSPERESRSLSLRSDAPIRMMLLTPSVPQSQDQVGLAIGWDGPKPSCNSTYTSPLPSPQCWLGVAGSAPLVTHAAVTWNNAVPFTVSATTEGGQWLTVTVTRNRACVRNAGTACEPQITLTADPSLPPGDYKAMVTILADDPTLTPASLPFVFRVTPSAVSIDAPGYLWFSVNDSIYSRGPARIPVNSSTVGTPFSVSIRETQDTGWLSVTPMQGLTPAVLNVYVAPSPSQYAGIGFIDISGPSNTVTEPVNMVVPKPAQPATYVLTPTPSSLTFWAKAGGMAPAPQAAAVNTLLDTITAETEEGVGWLSARYAPHDPSRGSLAGISVSVDPTGLATGVYHGKVTFSGPDTSPSVHFLPGHLPVTLIVWAEPPVVTMSVNELVISAPSGSSTFEILTASNINGPVSITGSAIANDGNDWLTARPFVPYPYGREVSGSLAIDADATGLPPGTYSGSVQVHAPPESPVAVTVPVAFNVTPKALPYLQPGPPLAVSLVNAASQTGGSIAPGEIVSMFGLDLGPHLPASYQVDAAGKIATNIAGLRVLFDEVPAPLLYVSETQVNAVVPYEVAGKTSAVVAVEINGMRFTTGARVVASAPGVFTSDGTGRGQAAAFNADTTANSAANAIARGAAISLLATGAGQTVPEGTTGQILQNDLSRPQLPVSVKIGNVTANLQSVEPVPGPVAGLFRIAAIVPQSVAPGPAVPVVLTIGSSSSPVGVTIAVR